MADEGTPVAGVTTRTTRRSAAAAAKTVIQEQKPGNGSTEKVPDKENQISTDILKMTIDPEKANGDLENGDIETKNKTTLENEAVTIPSEETLSSVKEADGEEDVNTGASKNEITLPKESETDSGKEVTELIPSNENKISSAEEAKIDAGTKFANTNPSKIENKCAEDSEADTGKEITEETPVGETTVVSALASDANGGNKITEETPVGETTVVSALPSDANAGNKIAKETPVSENEIISSIESETDAGEKINDNEKDKVVVPELEEDVTSNAQHINLPIIKSLQKNKIKFNKIHKEGNDEDDDIQEVPVVKPAVDIIEVPDEDMGDTEVVSEDELPPPPDKEQVDGAEEVSDEELPAAPKPDLPPEAEDVSDDEDIVESLEKKRKLEEKDVQVGDSTQKESVTTDKNVKTDVNESVQKVGEGSCKRKIEEVSTTTDVKAVTKKPREKSPAKEPPKKTELPELAKFWKTVIDDPSDFTGWTYLLQYIDQENNVEAAQEAYSKFLSRYPYCYGYWRKYADFEKKKGSQAKCEEVLEEGLKAIPLSVDLWIHFLNHCISTYPDKPDYIREQYERCVNTAGLEFRSDRLWSNYIKWELTQKEYCNVMKIYDRVLKIPLQGHQTHFESFQKFVEKHAPHQFLSVDEFLQLRTEVLPSIKKNKDSPMIGSSGNDDKPPGAEDDVTPGEEPTTTVIDVDEANAIKEKIVASRRKIHKENALEVTGRWSFEEGIKRPYFHVKPLEKCQLKNWKEYLEYEIKKGDEDRIIVLFERCLIACALYEEFWHKFIEYLQEKSKDVDKIRDVFRRSCTIHHQKKIPMHYEWAVFEEVNGNFEKVREILENIAKIHPNQIEIAQRRIGFEKRHGYLANAQTLYDSYLTQWRSQNKKHFFDFAVKYARFCSKILKNVDKAVEILQDALILEQEHRNIQDYTRLYFQLIDTALQRSEINHQEIVEYFDLMSSRTSLSILHKFMIISRKLEFLEEFGKDIKEINNTVKEFKVMAEQVQKSQESTQPPLPVAAPPPMLKQERKESGGPKIAIVTKSKNSKTEISAPPSSSSGPVPIIMNQQPVTGPGQGSFYGPPPSGGQYMSPPQFSNPPPNLYPNVNQGPGPYGQYPDPNNAYQQWYAQYGNYGPQQWPTQYGSYPQGMPPQRF